MCIEFEVRIEGHSQYTGVPFQGQYGVAQSDLGMDVRLRKLSGEKSDLLYSVYKSIWSPFLHFNIRKSLIIVLLYDQISNLLSNIRRFNIF